VLTGQELLRGAAVKMPPTAVTFKQAGKVGKSDEGQIGFTF